MMPDKTGWLLSNIQGITESVPGSSVYDYGYPASGKVESDVVAQWTCSEPNGNLIDVVSSYALVPTGTPGYGDNGSSEWVHFFGVRTGNGANYFDGGDTGIDPGASPFTIEVVASLDAAASGSFGLFGFNSVAWLGTQFYYNTNGTLNWYTQSTDGASCNPAAGAGTLLGLNDGATHKYRFVMTRGAPSYMYVDGVTYGSTPNGISAAKTIVFNGSVLGSSKDGSNPWRGVIREFRISFNDTNNSGGPGGG